ncbi:zinc finger, RanBP2-type [Artemisia annua]|uniref:Zinc finger, RanBP2-type n=1 Tax=Artemisia annua TaxID=35608 RepID=A0A2U1MP00_ARTAN|nr:zinc finger, RanBP2-type [Artemisia annua]
MVISLTHKNAAHSQHQKNELLVKQFKTLLQMNNASTLKLAKLNVLQNIPETELELILEAWMQLLQMNNASTLKLAKLNVLQNIPETELELILEAWMQIVECRRVLKWTYAYGITRNYFENLVRVLENGLSGVNTNVEASSETSSSTTAAAGTSKPKGVKGKGPTKCGASSRTDDCTCEWCTYENPKTATECGIDYRNY